MTVGTDLLVENWCIVYNWWSLWTCSSDIRLKYDISDFSFPNVLNTITLLDPKSFYFYDHNSKDKQIGLIAQEVEAIEPRLVTTSQNW